MTASDRSSARVEQDLANDLAGGHLEPISGGDGRDQLATTHARSRGPARIGRQRLAQLKTSLSDRQLSVLRSTELLKFASAKQIERLMYPVGEGFLTKLSAARSCRRDLAYLYEVGVIDRLERRVGGVRAGSASFVYTLSSAGARILGYVSRRRSQEPSLAHLDHVLSVGEVVVGLHEVARTDDVAVEVAETEPTCWCPIIGAAGQRQWLKPDLRVVLAVGDQELHWFVEVDRATEHRPVISRKCQSYVRAWQQGREQAEHGVFPRVLWVVPDERRAEALQGVIAGTGAPDGMFVVCIADDAVSVLFGRGAES